MGLEIARLRPVLNGALNADTASALIDGLANPTFTTA